MKVESPKIHIYSGIILKFSDASISTLYYILDLKKSYHYLIIYCRLEINLNVKEFLMCFNDKDIEMTFL